MSIPNDVFRRTLALAISAALAATGCEWVGGISDVNLVHRADETSGGCPTAGTLMARITSPTAAYCIDTTEVTRGQFADYLAAHPTTAFTAPDACVGTDASTQVNPFDSNGPKRDLPMAGASFCYAWDYCHDIGKRLCGAIGGGHATFAAEADPHNEWDYACMNGALHSSYPYGDAYDASLCATDQTTDAVAVGSHAGCHGNVAPFDRVFDLSGNVGELVDAASSFEAGGGLYAVHARGGSFGSKDADASCSGYGEFGMFTPATNDPPDYGFRCCADAK